MLLQDSQFLDPISGQTAYVMGVFISLLMWSFGLIWLVFALATVLHTSPFPFNMGWWGFTFPLGVYAANTMELGLEMDIMFFKVLGTVCSSFFPSFYSMSKWHLLTLHLKTLSGAVVLLWMLVASGTAHGAWRGSLFHAPCLQNLTSKEEGAERDGDRA